MNSVGNQIYFLQGIFNGLLWMMLLYNLFLYISLRDKSYLYYVLYVFFTSVFILNSFGYIKEFFSPRFPENILEISLSLSYVFYFMLMRIFLGSKENHPSLYKAISVLLYFNIASAPIFLILILTDLELYEIIGRLTTIVLYLPIIVTLIILFIKGDKLARYFVFGSLALFAGVAYIVFGLVLGHHPTKLFFGFQFGVIAQVFIFSMGLSLRYELMNRENIQSKYKALISQIDPHFFFNSLSVLSSLVYKNPDKSAEYINQLSKVYRNVLDKSEENIVPLENELKLLDSYIFLMKIRFGNNISFLVEISDNSKTNAFIPPNTLQVLVENAIKHNKCSSEEPLSISILEDSKYIYVKNNLNRRTLVDESSGIGLENVKHRFELLGGKQIVVNEDRDTFTVILPKYDKRDYESINI